MSASIRREGSSRNYRVSEQNTCFTVREQNTCFIVREQNTCFIVREQNTCFIVEERSTRSSGRKRLNFTWESNSPILVRGEHSVRLTFI